jgi:GAF domain-containing protein
MPSELLCEIEAILADDGSRDQRARRIAEAVRRAGGHRWVGIYDVTETEVRMIACSGPSAPAYPAFPVTKGLTGAAVRERKTVVVGDVANDPRYLTAFGSTASEMIVPVIDPRSATVIGTIDVESERKNAFSAADQEKLEECARRLLPLFSR